MLFFRLLGSPARSADRCPCCCGGCFIADFMNFTSATLFVAAFCSTAIVSKSSLCAV
jgi:hypothetical protein